MSKKRIIILLAIAGVLIIAFKGKKLLEQRGKETSETFLPREKTIAIKIVQPKVGTLEAKNTYLASVEAQTSINLSTKLTGYVKSINVHESDKVQKGEPLAQIDDQELLSSIRSLNVTSQEQQEALIIAKSIHSRNKKLYDVGGLAKEQYDLSALSMKNKESLVKNTEEKINQLQNQLRYLHIVAPFDGEIAKVFLREGDLASTGKSILTLNTLERKLLFSYPLGSSSIKLGQKVLIDDQVIGEVSAIYTMAENGLAQAEVKPVSNMTYPSGMSVNIDVITDSAQGCILPKNSMLHQKDGTYIMLYKNGKFIPQKIDIKVENDESVLLDTCQNIEYLAVGNENKLKELPVFGNVHVVGE